MEVWVVDNQLNPHYHRGFETVVGMVDRVLKPDHCHQIQGHAEFRSSFVNRTRTNFSPIITFIHDSFELPDDRSRQPDLENSLLRAVTMIREYNFRSRIVIYGFGSLHKMPIDHFVSKVKADTLWQGVILTSELIELIRRGPVSDDENKQRGRSIELIGQDQRLTGQGFTLHLPRSGTSE